MSSAQCGVLFRQSDSKSLPSLELTRRRVGHCRLQTSNKYFRKRSGSVATRRASLVPRQGGRHWPPTRSTATLTGDCVSFPTTTGISAIICILVVNTIAIAAVCQHRATQFEWPAARSRLWSEVIVSPPRIPDSNPTPLKPLFRANQTLPRRDQYHIRLEDLDETHRLAAGIYPLRARLAPRASEHSNVSESSRCLNCDGRIADGSDDELIFGGREIVVSAPLAMSSHRCCRNRCSYHSDGQREVAVLNPVLLRSFHVRRFSEQILI